MATNDKTGSGGSNESPKAPRTIAGAAPTPPASEKLDIPTLGTAAGPGTDTATVDAQPPAPAAAPQADTGMQLVQAMQQMMAAQQEQFAKMMAAAEERWSSARNNPVQIRHSIDGYSETPDKFLDIPVDRSLDDVRRTDLDIERGDPMTFESHAAEMKFMNDVLTVQVAESTDPNEQAVIYLSINGRPMYIQRGEPTRMRRCYVELLFRAKPQKVTTHVGKNRDDDVVNRVKKTSALAYPFQILQDPDPVRGPRWAAKMRKEG